MAENEETIVLGDIVQLKSGGPKMTADHKNNHGEWVCKWFRGTELTQGSFMPGSLTKTITE